jgi:hypothetical protein
MQRGYELFFANSREPTTEAITLEKTNPTPHRIKRVDIIYTFKLVKTKFL